MAWILLFLAGLTEVVWAVALKYAAGFTRPIPSVICVVFMAASVWLLALSMKQLPLGTAYAVWTGIGAVGSFIIGIFLFNEAASALRIASMVLIVAGLVGLKLSS